MTLSFCFPSLHFFLFGTLKCKTSVTFGKTIWVFWGDFVLQKAFFEHEWENDFGILGDERGRF
jgi:hypothetical protein